MLYENNVVFFYHEGVNISKNIRKNKLEPGKIIPLKYDFIFTSILNKEENISILENFISIYLNVPLNEVKGNIKILKRKLDLLNKKNSDKEVDLFLKFKNKQINIELSNATSLKVLGLSQSLWDWNKFLIKT